METLKSIKKEQAMKIYSVLNDKKKLVTILQKMENDETVQVKLCNISNYSLFELRRHIVYNWFGITAKTIVFSDAGNIMIKIRQKI